MNVFESDLFSVTTLTARINELDYVPNRLGQLGLFESAGIGTTHAWIEKEGDNLGLVAATPRGSPMPPLDVEKRKGIAFETFRLAERATVVADEVQNLGTFGSGGVMSLRSVEEVRDQKLRILNRRIEATREWHRVGAVRGILTQPNGDELVDIYDRFGLVQQTVDMELDDDTTKLEMKALEILEAQESALGGYAFTGSRAICGAAFWRDLISHPSIRVTYLNHPAAEILRADRRMAFEFGGIMWERYRGNVGGTAFVPTDEAYCFPEGIEGLFIERFAPADYMETVNTLGLPIYTKAELMKFDRGVELEAQSNVIALNTRPRSVIKLYRTSAGS